MDEFNESQSEQLRVAYEELVMLELQVFSRDELCALLDANNGTVLGYGGGWQWFHYNLEDSKGIAEKWSIDVPKLSEKYQALERDCKYRLAQLTIEFWSRCDEPTDALLIDLGLLKPQEAS